MSLVCIHINILILYFRHYNRYKCQYKYTFCFLLNFYHAYWVLVQTVILFARCWINYFEQCVKQISFQHSEIGCYSKLTTSTTISHTTLGLHFLHELRQYRTLPAHGQRLMKTFLISYTDYDHYCFIQFSWIIIC